MTDPMEREAWPEVRGPHLPDWLTAIPLLVWPFVILGAVRLLAFWTANRGADPDLLALSALALVGELGACLLGAALFLRHPDAIRSMPLVVVGVSLVAAEQAMRLIDAPLQPLFDAVAGGPDGDMTGSMIASSAFHQAATIVGLFGTLYIARGLDAARRFDGGTSRVVLVALAALSAVAIGLSTSFVLGHSVDGIAGGLPLYLASVVITFAALLATSYLAAVAFGGWRSGEEPALAWLLVALWGTLTIATGAVFTFVTVVAGFGQLDLSWAYLVAIAAAGLGLLVAFALGLPSTAPVDTPDEVDDAEPTEP